MLAIREGVDEGPGEGRLHEEVAGPGGTDLKKLHRGCIRRCQSTSHCQCRRCNPHPKSGLPLRPHKAGNDSEARDTDWLRKPSSNTDHADRSQEDPDVYQDDGGCRDAARHPAAPQLRFHLDLQ